MDLCSALVIGYMRVGPMSAVPLPLCVTNAPVDSCVHRLAFESTLSCVCDGHINDTLLTNLTGVVISLKSGVRLGSFEVCDRRSFHNPPQLISSVSRDTDFSHDTPDLFFSAFVSC